MNIRFKILYFLLIVLLLQTCSVMIVKKNQGDVQLENRRGIKVDKQGTQSGLFNIKDDSTTNKTDSVR